MARKTKTPRKGRPTPQVELPLTEEEKALVAAFKPAVIDEKGISTRLSNNEAELVERFCSAIEMGMYPQDAAAHAGFGIDTMSRWMRRGADQRGQAQSQENILAELEDRAPAVMTPSDRSVHVYWRFLVRFESSRANVRMRLNKVIMMSAGRGDWRAAARLLEALDAGSFAPKEAQKRRLASVEGAGLTVAQDYGGVSVEALETALLENKVITVAPDPPASEE